MANFAQSSPQQFSQYIPPTDLQQTHQLAQEELSAEVKVGMAKTEMYNINAQKIQGVIDNIVGLQVSKEVDKEYLNTVVGEMKNNINKQIAGQDLSKSSMFQKTGSLASRVYNDPNVQNAVISTKNEQDALAQIAQAAKDGKGAVSNDNMLMRNVQRWRNDNTLGSSLGKQQYTNYYDHTGELKKYLEGVHPNTVVRQSPMGNGGWEAYALVEGKEVRLDPMKLENDIQTFYQSNVQAQTQLEFDSIYYSDRTPTQAAFQQYQAANQAELQTYQSNIAQLEDESKLDPTKATENQMRITQYRDMINKKQVLNQEREAQFLQNPEEAKAQLFKNSLIQGQAQRYAYTDIEQKIVKNPYRDAMMEQARFNLNQDEFDYRKLNDSRNFDQQERKMQNDMSAARVAAGIATGGTYDAATAEAKTPESRKLDLREMGSQIAQEQYAVLYATNPDSGLVRVGQDANGSTRYYLNNGKTQQDFLNAWTQARQAYDDNPDGVNPDLKAYFENPESDFSGVGKLNLYKAKWGQYNQIETRLQEENRNNPEYMKHLATMQGVQGLNDVLYNEGGIKVTKEDILKVAQHSDDLRPDDFNKVKAETGLSEDKLKVIYERAKDLPQTTGGRILKLLPFGTLVNNDNKMFTTYGEMKKIADSQGYKDFAQKRITAYQNADRNNSDLYVSEAINEKNKTKLAAIADYARRQGVDVSAVTGQSKAGDIRVEGAKNALTGQYTMAVRNSLGNEVLMTVDQVTMNQFMPTITQTDPLSNIDKLLDANQGANQGIPAQTGKSYIDAFPVKNSNSEKYDFRYHIKRSADGSGYTPIGYYKPKSSKEWLPTPFIPKYMSKEAAYQYYSQLTSYGDAAIEQAFKK